ncbi:pyridoxal phosphate-dependent decarboxylase family protein, partial [Patulibacter defluvii]|uniref:pyridoxal phosphate-dependent decarboxylase family protein n=1 Tax=Patulibacter defluvii TaxID=3095358 RepID=UPI002A74A6AB
PPGAPAAALAAWSGADGPLPATGIGAERALGELAELLAAGHSDPADPRCAAHLHCPPLAVAVAADLAVSVLNPSLDSWDQGPSSLAVEDELIAALATLVGFDRDRAGGTMTTGGTASTLTALLLAREHAAPRPLRIACSELAHFSVQRAAQVLGIGEDAVATVAVGADGRLPVDGLERLLAAEPEAAWAVVATAGTTDLGAIDPLAAIARVAAAHGAWLHVDAAYGGGALFSPRLAPLLDGIAAADSLSLDAHKLGWQPVAAGVLLVRDRAAMAPLDRQVAYLNALDDTAAGYEDRLGRSLRTTRRPDAFKLLVTLRALGRDGLGRLVERCHELAAVAAEVASEAGLEVRAPPTLSTVLLRPAIADPVARDERCATVRRRLLREGRAVIGRTEIPGAGPGRRWLKLTLLNPHATEADVRALVALVADAARD